MSAKYFNLVTSLKWKQLVKRRHSFIRHESHVININDKHRTVKINFKLIKPNVRDKNRTFNLLWCTITARCENTHRKLHTSLSFQRL